MGVEPSQPGTMIFGCFHDHAFGISSSPAIADVVQPVVRREDEKSRLVVLGGADDGHGLREHQLVGQVGVQVHRAQEGCLAGVGVDLKIRIKSWLVGAWKAGTLTHPNVMRSCLSW